MDDLFPVAGKVAVLTGGSRGIGRMIAERLVASSSGPISAAGGSGVVPAADVVAADTFEA